MAVDAYAIYTVLRDEEKKAEPAKVEDKKEDAKADKKAGAEKEENANPNATAESPIIR